MFRWKKRDDGFEWHKYVRTTIKLRREARRDKAQKLGQQAAEGAKAASLAAGAMAQSGWRQFGSLAQSAAMQSGHAATTALGFLGQGLGIVGQGLGRKLSPALHALGRPGISGPLVFIGCIAFAAGLGRLAFAGLGLDAEAMAGLVTGLLCLGIGLGPSIWLGHSVLPGRLGAMLASFGAYGRPAVAGFVALALAGAGLLLAGPLGVRIPSMPGLPSLPFMQAAGTKVEGKASLIAADQLRIGETTIRLAGIDVPDRDQRCTRSGSGSAAKTWPCGEEARATTNRLIRAQSLTCEVGAPDGSGIVTGRCRDGTTDIGETLVRSGLAFADAGLMSPYRKVEDEAKATKSGLWNSATEPERPAAWRARLWAEAKQKAPDGCPIKGRIAARGERIYLLPWTTDYGRARISAKRGERWFCTEEEALAAGWRVGGRG